MDISSLKNLSAYKASLTDYLGGGKAGYFQDISANLLATAAGLNNQAIENDAATAAGVNITLSPEAQNLMAQGSDGTDSKQSGVQKGASNFMMSFFDQSGLDLENLSEDAVKLITGLQDVIGGSTATGRDMTTDMAEEKYAGGTRKAYTLTGPNTRLRLAIEYAEGKPTKLSITDITGGKVETAEITLQDGDKAAGTLTINRTQREYLNGHMTSLNESDPLEVDLYTAA